MRFSRPKRRTRLVLAGFVLLVVMATPLAIDMARASHLAPGAHANAVAVYATGLTALDAAAVIALPLAVVFALWLIRGEQRRVNVRILNQRARDRRNLIDGGRALLVIAGCTGLIVGVLTGLHAVLMLIRPDLSAVPGLPSGFGLALVALLGGGLAYWLGKLR